MFDLQRLILPTTAGHSRREFLRLGTLAAAGLALPRQFARGAESFEELHRLIKPLPGESKWAAIPWEISLQKARERSVQEDKPLFLWRAGGGDVLGRA
jgi:hypothetical protein